MRRLRQLPAAFRGERSRPDAVPVRPRRKDGSRGGSNRESVEPAVDDGQRARHERRSVADEVVNRTQLALLAGPSFHGSGIGPGSFAAIPSFRPGKEANTRTCEHANRGEHLLFACSRRIPASPLEAVLNRRILACSGESTVCEKFENLKTIHPCIFANNPGAGTVRTTP